MPRCKFAPYEKGQLQALRTLGLTCDKKTGCTEPLVKKLCKHGRFSAGTRAARLKAMKLLGIREGQRWHRPLAS